MVSSYITLAHLFNLILFDRGSRASETNAFGITSQSSRTLAIRQRHQSWRDGIQENSCYRPYIVGISRREKRKKSFAKKHQQPTSAMNCNSLENRVDTNKGMSIEMMESQQDSFSNCSSKASVDFVGYASNFHHERVFEIGRW